MGNRLRVLRAERRVSQLELSKRAGVHPSRYWRLENEILDPTPDEQGAIARALGVDIALAWPPATPNAAMSVHEPAAIAS